MFTNLGSAIAGLMFFSAIFQKYVPFDFHDQIQRYTRKFIYFLFPQLQITFDELMDERYTEDRSEAYTSIQNATRLKANMVDNRKTPVFSMADYEEVTDTFRGVTVRWTFNTSVPRNQTISLYPGEEERRYYTLTLPESARQTVMKDYIDYVLQEGRAIEVRNRQRKLFTNNSSDTWGCRGTKWSHVLFEHPATFDTLAMGAKKKEDIKKDLIKFSRGKEYYAKIGKAWKRGYLLYGPPGTGKSTMIAAIANFLDYDVYDLELTTVKNNIELRKLLIDTTAKSIIVIEDIDCSLDLTGQRKKKKAKGEEKEDGKDPVAKKIEEIKEERKISSDSEVTLSGLLNFIDGLWSCCGGERIIVFTTNFVVRLDPALIRRGRMDKHIEMGYCCFEAFKELAKNYLDVESHELFPMIEKLLGETSITPADVAENLMPKSDEEDEESCLKNLIEVLEAAKVEDARKKTEEEEEEKKKTEEEEKVAAEGDKEVNL